MKTKKMLWITVTAIFFSMLTFITTGCEKDETESIQEPAVSSAIDDYSYDETEEIAQVSSCIDSLPAEPISQEEEDALLLMREEEFLAHDVYLELSGIYSKKIFSNIRNSEFTHTTAIKSLLDKYNLPDPAANHVTGVFSDANLQQLYDQLLMAGSASLLDGLITGATIEDLDIYDLEEYLDDPAIDNQDIRLVFDNLMRGSRNHLRSFYSNIVKAGGTYSPQFISQQLFDDIIGSSHETGTGSCNNMP